MPFPLIPIIIGITSAAGLGLQAYDTFNKPSEPITVTKLQPTAQQTDLAQYTPYIIGIGALVIIVLLVVLH